MKKILTPLFGFAWMTAISIGATLLMLWIMRHCFYSEWWKVAVFVLFGTALFKGVWNAIVPIIAIAPPTYLATKTETTNSTAIASAIPPIIIGLWCLYVFWFNLAPRVDFDAKDWVSALTWSYMTASCFYHLTIAFISLRTDYSHDKRHEI